jgi:hypothetical protein
MRRTTLGIFAVSLSLTFAGCSSDSATDSQQPSDPGPSTLVTIDSSVLVDTAVIPPFEKGGPDRHVATMTSPGGNVMQFYENELVVAAKDKADVEAVVARYEGKILESLDLSDAGDDSGFTFYAVQIKAEKADVAGMDSALEEAGSAPQGLKISSAAALGTLAAFVTESKRGISVFPNFVMQHDTIADRETAEAPTASGNHSGDYSPNPYTWPYMQRGGALNMGVAEAWRVLEANGKLGNEVRVLVMDAGFKNDDLPESVELVGSTRFDVPNTGKCCNNTCDCPWHGTGSARAAAGRVNNSRGAAGSGGPVVRPLLLQSPREDFFDIIRYIGGLVTGVGRAQIISMSASTTVDQWVCDTSGFFMGDLGVCSFPHRIGAAIRAANVLWVASAGNNNARDLDSGDFTIPCEMAGTVCVGGLDWDAPRVSSGSTRASRRADGAIDIYAPFELWVGTDPADLTANEATIFSGTSASAPFVAGVAALIKAADPSLHANQVEAILKSTANTGTSSQAFRWINAYEAVKQAVGGATPGFITITKPGAGASEPRVSAPVSFKSLVESDGGTPTVTWSSSLDGPLGTGKDIVYPGVLSMGTHVISATVTVHGLSYTRSVDYTLTNTAPVVNIVSPGTGTNFYVGQLISLLGSSVDNNEPSGILTNAQVSWQVDGGAASAGHAKDIAPNTLSLGAHTIKFTGNDGELSASKQISINILPNPVNLPPNITSMTPASGTDVGYADVSVGGKWVKQVTLTAAATDPDGPVLPNSAYTWKTSYTNGTTTLTQTLGTGKSITADLAGLCNQATHTVTVTVTDGVNNVTKSATYYVSLLC